MARERTDVTIGAYRQIPRSRPTSRGLSAAVSRVLPWAGLALSVAFLVLFVRAELLRRGLFGFAGLDFGMFWAATRAFLADGPTGPYRVTDLIRFSQPLAPYVRPTPTALAIGQAPFLPLFFVLFAPIAVMPPVPAFAVWSLLAGAVTVASVRRLAGQFDQPPRWLLPTLIVYFPLAFSLFLGQISFLLVWALIEAYTALQEQRNLKAGLWCGLLLLKPQYLWVLVVVFAWKRQWRFLVGLAGVAAVLGFSSLAVLGLAGLEDFVRLILTDYTGFQHVQLTVFPEQMISWRGLLLNLLPHASERVGQGLTVAVSAATCGAAVATWRGPWEPGSRRFHVAMLATVAAMLLCGYHSHLQDAALLLVPAAAVAANWQSSRLLRVLLYLSTLMYPAVILSGGFLGACIITGVMLIGIVVTVCVWSVVAGARWWSEDLAEDDPSPVAIVSGTVPR